MNHNAFALTLAIVLGCAPAVAQLIYDGPIIDRAGRYDGYPVHLKIDGVHHMWFCGESPVTDRDAIFHSQKSGTLRTTSGWSQPTELFNINDVGWAQSGGGVHVCDPSVILGDFQYEGLDYGFALYFTADVTNLQGGDNAIGVAFSNDGVSWTIHDQPVILPEGGYDGSYGAGAGGVAWGPEPDVVHHTFRDSTTVLETDWRIRYKSSTNGLDFSPTPSLDTHLSDAALSSLGSAPEIAFFAPQNRWFAAIQEVAGGDSFTGRILRADEPEDLFATWSTIAGLDSSLSSEELLILPSIAKNENSSLLVDDEGWIYIFFTTGNNRGSGAGIDTWKVGQARYRLVETDGSYIEDGFLDLGQNRRAGEPLTATTSEVGDTAWITNGPWVLGAGYATVDSSTAGTSHATIAFDPNLTDREVLEVEVDPTGTDWLAVGFSSASGAGLFGGELWIQLNPNNGRALVFADGTNHLQGSVDGLVIGPSHTLRLEYEESRNSASAWIDDTSIVRRFDLNPIGFTPSPERAGFHAAFGAGSTPKILDFRVNQLAAIFRDGFELGTIGNWSSGSVSRPEGGFQDTAGEPKLNPR